MQVKELRGQSAQELHKLLLEKLRERFNLRMQRGSGQSVKASQVRAVRRDIARIKTVVNELKQAGKA